MSFGGAIWYALPVSTDHRHQQAGCVRELTRISGDDWIHLELRNLKRANIEAYRDKWLAAQGLTAEERGMVTSTLGEKPRSTTSA